MPGCLETILFENLQAMPADAILKLIAEHENDTRVEKIDLGVGVYRDERGQTPVLGTVKKAERYLIENQPSNTSCARYCWPGCG